MPATVTGSEIGRRRLVGLMLLRTTVVTVLLGVLIVLRLHDRQPTAASFLSLFIGVTYLLTIGYALALRLVPIERLALIQLGGDIITTTVLVYGTGGAESPFTLLYFLSVIGAAVVISRRASLVTAALSSVLLAVGTLLLRAGLLGALGRFSGRPLTSSTDSAYAALVNVAALFLLAILGGYLAQELRRTGISLVQTQLRFRDLATLLEHIIEGLTSGLITTDLEYRVAVANRAARELLGKSDERLGGQPLTRVAPTLAALLAEAAQTPERRLLRSEAAHGPLTLGASVVPLFDHEHHQVGWILSFQDVTRVKQLEAEVRRAEQLATIGRLSAGVAHELRNPLGAISGAVELIRATVPLGDDEKRLVDIALSETDRLNKLVTGLLEYARPTRPQLTRVDVAELVKEIAAVWQNDTALRSRGITLTLELPDAQGLAVSGDPGQLRQVLWNLLRNAAEASADDGTIVLSARAAPPGAGQDADERVELIVTDQGEGMSPEQLAQLFEPFFSTKPGGTGLGLPIVQRIVHEHHGEIAVDSTPGQGTRVTITLPAHVVTPVPVTADAAAAAEAADPRSGVPAVKPPPGERAVAGATDDLE